MKKEYDIIYLTNTPSFYKINLCNGKILIDSIMYFSLREMLRNETD